MTGAVYDGLDVSGEIRTVASQDLGDTVLLRDDPGLAGLAVCYCGAANVDFVMNGGRVYRGPETAAA